MNKTLRLMLAILTATTLVACGGGGEAPVPLQVAATNTNLAASPTTTAAVANTTFAYPTGISSFGTTATTTVAFTNTSTTPAFSISSGGNTASGTTTFGSCHFLVTQSTFTAPSPLTVGSLVVVNPCNITVNTAGQVADGVAKSRSVALVLGAAASSGASLTVSISTSGQIILNGTAAGTVTLAPVTGGA